MINKTELLIDVLLGRHTVPFWRTNQDGSYTLQINNGDGKTYTDVIITDSDLAALDPRLSEVVSCMQNDNVDKIISHKRLALTVFSHWQRENHVFRANAGDALTAKRPGDLDKYDWYLHEFHNIRRHQTDFNLVHLRVNAYRIEKTQIGIEYAREKQQFGFFKPMVWLDGCVHQGSTLLTVLEALDVPAKERGAYLQAHYLPTVSPQAEILPITGLHFF